MNGIMAAESSGMSTNPYDSEDNDDLFLPKSSSSSSGLIHLQIPNSNHGPSDTHSVGENIQRDYLNPGYQEKMASVQLDSHLRRQESVSPPDTPEGRLRQGSIVDGLLHEIYDRWHFGRHDSFDSDTLTECSSTSECLWSGRNEFFGNFEGGYHSSVRRQTGSLSRSFLQSQTVSQLERLLADVQRSVAVMSARLVRQLKRRDRRIAKLGRNCDVVTAILQAASLKRQIDTRMRFSIQPPPGESAFDQWRDAMKAVARLPMGIPPEFRKKVWLSLADHYLVQLRINWEKTVRFVFNERSNPDDDKLGVQIVKDLHRTGCSNFSGDDNEEDRAILKRVLLAYARWNKRVGYCQGFNVIAALLLNVMDRKEDDALKVMIYLIDSVLPESYFANNLRALSVDMAVFRDLLGLTYQRLSKHLDRLQLAAQDVRTGACYEPPLTNVFTMQWFLTLFATCLPVSIVLRVWDSVLLEGSEILLRTALTIWGRLSKRIMTAHSADEFYSLMGELSSSIMQGAILDGDTMVKSIYALGEFPLPHINELREKYTYNIRPFTPAGTSGKKGGSSRSVIKSMLGSDDDELDDDDIAAMACMPGEMNGSSSDISVLGPGVYGSGSDPTVVKGTMQMERMSTDISNLKLQYQRLKQRQQQAHIIIAAASAKKTHQPTSSSSSKNRHQRQQIATMSSAALLPNIESPTAMNHLFVGKAGKLPSSGRNRLVTEGPRISELPTARKSGLLAKQLQAVAKAQAVSKSQRMRSGSMRTAEATSNTSQGQSPSATHVSATSSSNLEIEQSNLSPSIAIEKSHQERVVAGPISSEQCEKNSEESQCSNNELSCHDVMKASCLGQELEITHSEIPQTGQTVGDHISLSQTDELISSNCRQPKQIQENHSESYKTDLSCSHSVPSDILRKDSASISELSSDSTLEENVDTASLCSDLPLVNIDSSSDKTSPEAMIKNFDVSCFPGSFSDPQQEDSGVESSSTTSPSITPGKRLCQEEHLSSNEAVHENEDEDLVLSVETAFAPEDMERTISVSHIENATVEFEYEIEDNGQRHNVCHQSKGINESRKVPQLCECEDDDVKNHSKELVLSNEFGNGDTYVQTQKPNSDSEELKYDDPQKHSNSSDHCEDVSTLLGMVATTSPQRKYIRSMSVPKSSYMPSPSLIETISVPETLDVEEEANAKAVSKSVLRGVKSLDQNGALSQRKQTSDCMNAAKKHKTSSTESITKEKRKEVNELRNERQAGLQEASQTNKPRLSSPSLSFPLNPEGAGHQDSTASSKHSPSKPFNPFPIKLFNANRAKTGLKLGLYTASTLQQLKGVKGRTSST